MKLDWRSPYAKRVLLTAIVCVLSVAVLVLFFRVLQDSGNIYSHLSKLSAQLGRVLTPFAAALLLGYILFPIVRFIETRLLKPIFRADKWQKLRRGLAVAVTYVLLIFALVWIVSALWPVLWKNTQEFSNNLPGYIDSVEKFMSGHIQDNPLLSQPSVFHALESAMDGIGNQFTEFTSQALQSVLRLIRGTANAVTGIFIALIGSIYCLTDGARMLHSLKRLTMALFGQRRGENLVELGRLFERVFGVYVRARLFESLVVFVFSYVGFLCLGISYSALLALVNAIFNLVPYFGPILGGALTMLVLLLVDPMQALYAGLLVLVIQQLDGYVLGPKLMGDSLNMRPLYIMLSVSAAGTFFGVPGMLLIVPVVAFFSNLLRRFIDRRLGVSDAAVKQP